MQTILKLSMIYLLGTFSEINKNIKKFINLYYTSKQQILCHLAYIRITYEQITTKFA